MNKVLYLISLVAVLASCCKAHLLIGITVEYAGLSGDHQLKVIQSNDLNSEEELAIYELNEDNNHHAFVEFRKSENYSYVLQVDSALHSDTISNVNYEIKGRNCNQRVDKLSYNFNSLHYTDNYDITIQ